MPVMEQIDDASVFADATRAGWFMLGAGGNMVWIDPDNLASQASSPATTR